MMDLVRSSNNSVLILFKNFFNINIRMLVLKRKTAEAIIKHLEGNPDEQTDKTFVDLCKNGELKSAIWLFDNGDINLTFNNSQCIRDSAGENRLDVIEWLYPKNNWLIKVDAIFDDENEYESLLCYCCRFGYFPIIKYIYKTEDDEIIAENNDEAFGLCCQGGFIKIAAWIINQGYWSPSFESMG